MRRTKTQTQELEKAKRQNEKLLGMIADEREKVAGYEQVAKLHAAYIGVLLRKLGATKDNPVTITKEEAAEAMKQEARGYQNDGGWALYVEE